MNDQKLLSQEFLNQYPSHPEHMSPLGLFTFYRTYSRFLPEEKRRETWKETVARAVEYNVGLQAIHEIKNSLPVRAEWLREEAQKLFDSIFNLKQFPSGRTLFIGGTKVSRDFPMANFNCSFTNISKWSDLRELFYLLMLGSGVGLKATKETLKDMPPIRTQTTLILSPARSRAFYSFLLNSQILAQHLVGLVERRDVGNLHSASQ